LVDVVEDAAPAVGGRREPFACDRLTVSLPDIVIVLIPRRLLGASSRGLREGSSGFTVAFFFKFFPVPVQGFFYRIVAA
jgi:hypothetical protein